MRYNRFIALGASLGVLAMCWAVAAGGGADDPVISKSYLESTVAPRITNEIVNSIVEKIGNPEKRISEITDKAVSQISNATVAEAIADVAMEELQARGKYWYNAPAMEKITLRQGDVLCGDIGTKATVFSGGGVIYGNPVVNVTTGYEYSPGSSVILNSSYFFTANDGSSIKFTADSTVGIEGRYKILSAVRVPRYTDLARALSQMNLVRGTANGFELHRGATRAEAITMLVRLLAEENQAMTGNYPHNFTDVDTWADSIVGYSVRQGYANGVAVNKFGASSPTTANHYMTFILRALGYDDTKGDFVWNEAVDYAVRYGVLTPEEGKWISSTPFTRDHMVYMSYYALFANVKDSDRTLLYTLIDRGAVSAEDAQMAISQVTRER